jgi:hypothetical protein
LIAVADALVKRFGYSWHTWYFILVRPVDSDQAIVLTPYHCRGRESVAGWVATFGTAPQIILARILALVCDGHPGLVRETKMRSWLLQRCHFHLLASIQGRRSKWIWGRHRAEGQRLFDLVKTILCHPHEQALGPAIKALEKLGQQTASPVLQAIISGFITNYRDYRTYLTHPDLRLPTTNNTAETLISQIEGLCQRAHGFPNAAVCNEWITVLIKTRDSIKCRPKNQQN